MQVHAPARFQSLQSDYAQAEALRLLALRVARQHWQTTHDVRWLMPMLLQARPGELSPAELKAAATVADSTPAYQTLQYQLARLALQAGHADAANTRIDAMLAQPHSSQSIATRNRWLGLKLLSARTLNGFMLAAPRKLAEPNPGVPIPNESSAAPTVEIRYDSDFYQHLLHDFSLAELQRVRLRTDISADLRKTLTDIIWTRAVLLGDYASATALTDAVVQGRDTTRTLYQRFKSASSKAAKKQAATLIFVNAPELSPTAIQQNGNAPYWGCAYDYNANFMTFEDPPRWGNALTPNFQPGTQRQAAQRQRRLLHALPLRSDYLAPSLLAYARQHPDDTEVPKALHFLVAATRLECPGGGIHPRKTTANYSRDAFRLLHQRYPGNEWTLKTPYYF